MAFRCLFPVSLQIISSGEDTANLIKSMSYYIAIILEVFVYCFAGEFLSAKVCKRVFSGIITEYIFMHVTSNVD